MNQGFKALILNHKHASVQVREGIALSGPQAQHLLAEWKELCAATDLLVLSTCNRTEFYYTAEEDLTTVLKTLVQTHKGLSASSASLAAFQPVLSHTAAVQHLFRVGLGLESQVPGDMQIIAQVKDAYQITADAQAAGPFLHRLLHTIFYANKRVVQETRFRTGAASLAYATQALAEEMLLKGVESRIVVIGVGEMGANICRNLTSEGYRNVVLLNRTPEKAAALATECGVESAGLEQLATEVCLADAVISCVSVDKPLLLANHFAELPYGKRVLVFDLGVPRSVDAAIEKNPAILLYNIDELELRTTQALQLRLAEIPKVETIMHEALIDFTDWSREMTVSPAINGFKNALEQMRQEELARYIKNISEADFELISKVTGALVQRIVKLPVLELKAACRRGDAENMMESLASLFNLEMAPQDKTAK